jgi:tRNA(Ile)-lysidine synthase
MQDTTFISHARQYIDSESLIERGNKILVAVSGGIDSMTLLDVLTVLSKDLALSLAIAHVQYGLRGDDSVADEEFVRRTSDTLSVPCYVKRIPPGDSVWRERGSVQELARAIRYDFFEQIRRKIGFDLVATGHTANDNAETVLLHVIRGSGPDGLSGIPVRRGVVIRPLLWADRKQIESYATSRGILSREDRSNNEGTYTRNLVRNKIIPFLETQVQKNVVRSIIKTASINRSLDGYLNTIAEEIAQKAIVRVAPDEYEISQTALETLHPAIADYVVRFIARQVIGTTLSFTETISVRDLLAKPVGTVAELENRFRVYRERDKLRFIREPAGHADEQRVVLNESYVWHGSVFRISGVTGEAVDTAAGKNVEFIDADKIHEPFLLRPWREGDRFIPFGMEDEKKVSDLFIDEKVPRAHRKRRAIFEANGTIVWVCGTRLDNRVRVTPETKSFYKIEFTPLLK